MSRVVALALSPIATRIAFRPRGFPGAVRLWRTLKRELLDPYRPERHYMRGPGPKWRAKHRPDRA